MSLSNDLLSYSIMKNAGSRTPIHHHSLITLPPLSPIIRVLKEKQNSVILPPINYTSSSTYNTYSHGHQATSQSQPRPGSGDLTEYNLSHWNSQSNGLGLLSAIAHMNSSTSQLESSAGSISSASSAAPSSPGLTESVVTASLAAAGTSLSVSSAAAAAAAATKRRQRLGPSCDSCRSRKVKCNAEISVLSKSVTDGEMSGSFQLSESDIALLNSGETVPDKEGLFYVVSNGKLIRFKSCKSCKVKRLSCCFSSGFTKEDIISGKKVPKKAGAVRKIKVKKESAATVPPAVVSRVLAQLKSETSPAVPQISVQYTVHTSDVASDADGASSRKSSCVSCRKRKVKCVFNEALQKCEGCNKKNTECFYGKAK